MAYQNNRDDRDGGFYQYEENGRTYIGRRAQDGRSYSRDSYQSGSTRDGRASGRSQNSAGLHVSDIPNGSGSRGRSSRDNYFYDDDDDDTYDAGQSRRQDHGRRTADSSRMADSRRSDANTGRRMADSRRSDANTGRRMADSRRSDANTGRRMADSRCSDVNTGRYIDDSGLRDSRHRQIIEQMRREKRRQQLIRRILLRVVLPLCLIVLTGGIIFSLMKKASARTEQTAAAAASQTTAAAASATSEEAASAASTAPAAPFSAAKTDTTADPGNGVGSKYAILVNLQTNEILYDRESDARINPASMTKVLSCLVAAEQMKSIDDTYTITQEDTDFSYVNGCSQVGFEPGEKVTVKDLLYGLILSSGGDAASGLANYTAGSMDAFVEMMNRKLDELGLSGTAHFTNDAGIYDADHYCTAYDMAMIMEAAMKNDVCKEVLSAHTYTTSQTTEHPDGLLISNWFLRRIEDKDCGGTVVCAKTGYVEQSGNCAVSYATDADGNGYIAVTADAWSGWRAIFDHVALYKMVFEPGSKIDPATTENSAEEVSSAGTDESGSGGSTSSGNTD
jgi:D-alanyl-D-alanine carboxypeptidase (penicillin-binding protein 5/6)